MSTFAAGEYQRRVADGWWIDTRGHLPFLHQTALSYEMPVIIELGVDVGNTTSALLSAVEQVNGMLWSCDIADASVKVPAEFVASPHWHLLHGDDCSLEILKQMPDQCEVLYVDTDHTTEHTLAVMNAYVPRVKPGGIALFHDTEWEYPATQLPGPTSTVAAGITQYCEEHNLTWENHHGYYGLGVVRL